MKQPSSTRATIRDVAREAGVSIKTVSRVINKEASIRVETRQRVEAAIDALHYIPNMAARGLAGTHSFKLALLIDQTQKHVNFHYSILLQSGVLDCCRHEGYDLLIHPCEFSSPRLPEDIEEMARVTRLTGLILIPPLSDNERLLQHLEATGVHFATMSSIHEARSVANVVCDDVAASRAITQHLIGLGHREIAFIKGHPAHGASAKRLQGFSMALAEAGLKLADDHVEQGYFDFESGREAAGRLLALNRRPRAIFASNDEMAAGVIHEAYREGLRVPEDLSVTGFDDSIIARQTFPTLTTVRQPTRDMARQAARLLVEARRPHKVGDDSPRLVRLEHEIVIRHSTAPPPDGKGGADMPDAGGQG